MNVESRLAKASEIFGYIFRDKAKCAEALQMDHNPLIIDVSPLKVPKNNRLAIVGDAILDATLCKIWYGCSHANEPLPAKAWSTVRDEVLGNKALHVRGESLGLGSLVLVNGRHWDLPISEKMMATTFEAIFGAISVDGGEEAVLQSVKHLGMDKHIFLVGTSLTRGGSRHPVMPHGLFFFRGQAGLDLSMSSGKCNTGYCIKNNRILPSRIDGEFVPCRGVSWASYAGPERQNRMANCLPGIRFPNVKFGESRCLSVGLHGQVGMI